MKQQQSGAALVLSLLILLVLTVLGLSSMRTATMEELMTRNTRDYKIAFEAADSTLKDGSKWVGEQSRTPRECSALDNCGANPAKVYKKHLLNHIADNPVSWWKSTATKEFLTAGTKDIPEAKADPRLAMDATFVPDTLTLGHGMQTGKHVYRVSGRGTGLKDSTKVIVQQTVVKRFN